LGRRARLAVLGACLAVGLMALSAGSAQALQYTPRVLERTVEGSEVEGGTFGSEIAAVAVDQQSGDMYALTTQTGVRLYKFDAQGHPSNFASTGTSELTLGATETCSCSEPKIKVDNSGGPHQGRIYVAIDFIDNRVFAIEPDGTSAGGNFPLPLGSENLVVSPVSGNFYLSGTPLVERAYEYDQQGVKTNHIVDLSQYGGTFRYESGPHDEIFAYAREYGLLKVNQAGNLIGTIPSGGSFTYGVDQVSGDVLEPRFKEAVLYDNEGDQLPGINWPTEEGPQWFALNGVNHYIYVAFRNSIDVFKPLAPVTLAEAHNQPATNIHASSLTLNATVEPAGVETTECVFEYGTSAHFGTITYEDTAPCEQGQNLTGTGVVPVSADISSLSQGGTYHWRLKVTNANGSYHTRDATVIPSEPPVVANAYVTDPHVDSITFHAEITPEGDATTYHVLYGTGNCTTEPGTCAQTPEAGPIGSGLVPVAVAYKLTGLQAGTNYHYIVVATNPSGTAESTEETFTTFPLNPTVEDRCANAHVRQQTGSALLSDCRAYELVSAADANGYDVESYLTEGQTPFAAYPEAEGPSRLLYGVHDGALPGTGHPTNHGIDPYIATRGEDGWSTAYVGVPANLPYSHESFASPLLGADAKLDTFAFGGEGLCSPCFPDGSTGVPVALPDGSIVQGMAGSENPGPEAEPDMLVKKPLSADGKHVIFGSTDQFVAGAGSPAIYERDLETGTTSVISNLPGGGPIPCLPECGTDGLAELDVSADGSRVVIGQLLRVDSAGNRYWHLYMDVGASSRTIDLTPGTTEGAIYGGMTSNGGVVYFTTSDRLTGEDTDESADLYRADVGGSSAALTLISIGSGNGNSDACAPLADSRNEHWNSIGTTPDCDVVAVGGGGGVAAEAGAAYFLSPELLAGTSEPQDGTVNQPNLYVSRPGAPLQFVSTLESTATGPAELLEEHPFEGSFGAAGNTQFVAVDNSGGPSDGDVYVVDGAHQVIRKYDAEGNPVTGWKSNGEFAPELSDSISGIAVGSTGTLYVAIHKELNSGNRIYFYDPEGNLTGATFVEGAPAPIGIAVDDKGEVFYEGYSGQIWRWSEATGSTVISTAEYESVPKTGLAVDPTTGTLYVGWGGIAVGRFSFDSAGRVIEPTGVPCPSTCEPTELFGEGEISGGGEMFVDPTRHELYVEEGNRILRYHASGKRAGGPDVGARILSNSQSVAVSSAGNLYATNASSAGPNVARFGPLRLASDPRTDNPVVVDSVNESGTRRTGDFQITPNGNDAVFLSTIPYTGYVNGRFEEVFRFDTPSGALGCVSCNPTGIRASGGASLARNGLSLTDEGRVFFDTTEPLVPRDLDQKEDVYEWENGVTNLVSTGLSPFNSSLLTASARGTDAYFFTRDTLAPQDTNGSLVKVYDARENGGFPYTPPPVSCKASDECHGPSTQPGASPPINTLAGTGGNEAQKPVVTCKKSQVKKHGKCVKKKKHQKKKHQKKKHQKKKSKKHGKHAAKSAGDKKGRQR
jgi:hypothetical protein